LRWSPIAGRVLYQGAFGAADSLPFHAIAALPPKRLLA
jgi:hypothetical protein